MIFCTEGIDSTMRELFLKGIESHERSIVYPKEMELQESFSFRFRPHFNHYLTDVCLKYHDEISAIEYVLMLRPR